jgi:hypothetical protein
MFTSNLTPEFSRPGDIVSSLQVLRMKGKLIPVGCNELFGGVATSRRSEPRHATIYFSIHDAWLALQRFQVHDGLRQLPPLQPEQCTSSQH